MANNLTNTYVSYIKNGIQKFSDGLENGGEKFKNLVHGYFGAIENTQAFVSGKVDAFNAQKKKLDDQSGLGAILG